MTDRTTGTLGDHIDEKIDRLATEQEGEVWLRAVCAALSSFTPSADPYAHSRTNSMSAAAYAMNVGDDIRDGYLNRMKGWYGTRQMVREDENKEEKP